MTRHIMIGVDLAGKPQNRSGWIFWKNKRVKTSMIYTDGEMVEGIVQNKPTVIAIDAPFHLPREGLLRKTDKEMIMKEYRVFPPRLPGMQKLTLRAIKLNRNVAKTGYKRIEVHPTSARKALCMPPKDWRKIQTILAHIGLEGDVRVRTLISHEIDAVTAVLTAYLYLRNQTEALEDEEEGYIFVSEKRDWRTLKL